MMSLVALARVAETAPSGLELVHVLPVADGAVTRLAWSLDGTRLAAASTDGHIYSWSLATATERRLGDGSSEALSVAWIGPEQVACVFAGGTIEVWGVDSGIRHNRASAGPAPSCVAVSPALDLLATGCSDGVVRTRRLPGWRAADTISGHSKGVTNLAWSPGGRILASASHDGTIRLWDRVSRTQLDPLLGHTESVQSIDWSPRGHLLASVSADCSIRVWDMSSGECRVLPHGHLDCVNCVSFSYDGEHLASKSVDGTVRLWSSDSWTCVAILREDGPSGWGSLAFHPFEHRLATLGLKDRVVRIWNVSTSLLAGPAAQQPASPVGADAVLPPLRENQGRRRSVAFLGHSFGQRDKRLTKFVDALLRELGFVVVTGERPELRSVSSKVMDRIEQADLFVALLTRAGKLDGSAAWKASDWILHEMAYAQGRGKEILVLREDGVIFEGALLADLEYVKFSRARFDDLSIALIQMLASRSLHGS